MAETSGDVVVVETAGGPVEGRRMGRADSGPSRWRITYSWGAETFFGTSSELIVHAQKRVLQEAADAPKRDQG